MKIKSITSPEFRKYGKILESFNWTSLLETLNSTPLPQEVVYVSSVPSLESLDIFEELCQCCYGGLPIQIGYCNGHNNLLNGLEYHRSSEIDVASTDLILLLGLQQDIDENFCYQTSLVEAFFVPANTAVELYATTLHYAPCSIDAQGFRCAIILPKGTNEPLNFSPRQKGEEKLLTAKNKWLLAHPEAKIANAWNGLCGKYLSI